MGHTADINYSRWDTVNLQRKWNILYHLPFTQPRDHSDTLRPDLPESLLWTTLPTRYRTTFQRWWIRVTRL